MKRPSGPQIKKGVRALGIGGDGATIGNYSLIYRDAGGAVASTSKGVFGQRDNAVLFTLNYDYARMLQGGK